MTLVKTEMRNKISNLYSLLFALIMTFYISVNYSLDNAPGKLPISTNAICNGLFFFIIGKLIYYFLKLLFNHIKDTSLKKPVYKKSDSRYFLIVFAITLASYVITLLALYPGVFHYDSSYQLDAMVINGAYSEFHPLIHTLYLELFYNLGHVIGSYTVSMAISNLIQCIAFAIVVSYLHLFLKRMEMNKYLRYFFIFLFAFMPYCKILAVSATKDTFFSMFVLLFFIMLAYKETDIDYFNRPFHKFLFVFSVVNVCLWRNNGKYLILPAIAVCIYEFIKHKQYALRFLVMTLIGFVMAVIIGKGMKYSLDAEDISIKEMLSVPVQQLGYTYNHYDITEADKDALLYCIPNIDAYNAHLSDNLKDTIETHFNFIYFTKIWMRHGLRHPIAYIKAELYLVEGYLNIADRSSSLIYGDFLPGYLQLDVVPGFGICRDSKIKALENYYYTMYSDNYYFYNPLLRLLCQPSFYMWIILFSLCYIWEYRKNLSYILPLLAYILTLFLGPCVLIRYALPYILVVPIIMMIVPLDNK